MLYMYTIHMIQVKHGRSRLYGVPDVPLHVINNYFSISANAQIALLFHNERGIYSGDVTVDSALQVAWQSRFELINEIQDDKCFCIFIGQLLYYTL